MNRENKTQTVRKRLLQDPRLQRSFCLQGVRTHGSAAGRGQRPQKPLPELPLEPACRHRAGRQSRGLRGNHGPHSGLGEKKRRVGDSPPLPHMRRSVLKPHRRGRQPDEADEHSDETAVLPAVPDRAYKRTDGAHGRRRGARITRKKITE